MGVLVIVSGRPGSGRTVASRLLAAALGGVALDAADIASAFDDEAPGPIYGPGARSHAAALTCAHTLAASGTPVVVDAPFSPDVLTADVWSPEHGRTHRTRRIHLLCHPQVCARRLAAAPTQARQRVLDDFDSHTTYWDDIDAASPVRTVADNSYGVVDTSEMVARLCAEWGLPTRS